MVQRRVLGLQPTITMPSGNPTESASQPREVIVILATVISAAVVFALDTSVERGVAGAVPYVGVVWLALLSRRPWMVFVCGVVCSVLTGVGLILSPDGGELWKVLANRGLALFAIWVTVASSMRLRSAAALASGAKQRSTVWSALMEFPIKRTVLLLIVFFSVGLSLAIWQQTRLQHRLVESAAEAEAKRYTKALSVFRTLYTRDVVGTARNHKILVTHDFHSPANRGKAIPLPATMSMQIGNELTRTASGGGTRLYSAFPFPYPDRNGLSDSFAKEAWAALNKDPESPFKKFEEVDGRLSLRYAIADRMRPACVACHNEHVDSPKRDWKEDDVRGVLEVTLPLDTAVEQARGNLRESLLFLGTMAVVGVVILGLIIGRLKQTAELQTRLASIVESSDDAIIGETVDGVVTNWNRGAERLYGYSADEMVGQSFTRIVAPDRVDEVPRLLQDLRDGNRIDHFETVRIRKDGSRVDVSLTVSPIRDSGGKLVGTSAIARDITDKKRAALALREQSETLERLVKERTAELRRSNADLEQFAYVASHDLQEPLRAVVGFSQLLEQKLGDAVGDNASYLAHIVEGGSRMQTLISDLLEYSRVHLVGTPFEASDVGAVVTVAINQLDAAIREAGAEVVCGPMPRAIIDRRQFTQLFQNLIGNAIKYRGDATPRIDISCADDSENWIFTVRDNGIGIDPQFHEQIFVIFKRLHTRRQYSGTGIGLALCKRIVDRHGGSIRVESRPDEGSAFHVTIPKQPPSQITDQELLS